MFPVNLLCKLLMVGGGFSVIFVPIMMCVLTHAFYSRKVECRVRLIVLLQISVLPLLFCP